MKSEKSEKSEKAAVAKTEKKKEKEKKKPGRKPGPKPKEKKSEGRKKDVTKQDDYAACPFCCSTDQDDMVQCDKCQAWIHSACAGLTEDDLAALDEDDEATSATLPPGLFSRLALLAG